MAGPCAGSPAVRVIPAPQLGCVWHKGQDQRRCTVSLITNLNKMKIFLTVSRLPLLNIRWHGLSSVLEKGRSWRGKKGIGSS